LCFCIFSIFFFFKANWQGGACETPIDTTTCYNGGTKSGNTCVCTPDWTGTYCESPMQSCSPPCDSSIAYCDTTNSPICKCKAAAPVIYLFIYLFLIYEQLFFPPDFVYQFIF